MYSHHKILFTDTELIITLEVPELSFFDILKGKIWEPPKLLKLQITLDEATFEN